MAMLNSLEFTHDISSDPSPSSLDNSTGTDDLENDNQQSHLPKRVKYLMIQAFIICYYCMCIGVAIKKPLCVTKVALHNDLNFNTVQLSHIDGVFLFSRAVGQLIIPFFVTESYWRSFIFVSLIIMSISLFILSVFSTFYTFLFLYALIGFVSSCFYPIIMNNLVTWLPKKLLVKLLLLWVTSNNFGAIFGTILCTIAIRLFNWRSCFIVISTVVFIAAFLIRNIYIDPKGNINIGQQDTSNIELEPIGYENTNTDNQFVDVIFSEDDTSGIDKIRSFFYYLIKPILTNRDSDNDGTNNLHLVSNMWKQIFINLKQNFLAFTHNLLENNPFHSFDLYKYFSQYRTIFFNCPKLFFICFTHFFINLINYSFFFWMPFYLTTQLKYDSELASDLSMIFDFGGFLGIILASLTTDLFPIDHRIAAGWVWSVLTFVSVSLFEYLIKFGKVFVIIGILLVGITLTGTNCIITTLSIYDIFKNSSLDESHLSIACSLILSFGSIGAVLQSYLTTSLANSYGWSSVFLTFCAMSFFSSVLMILLHILDRKPPCIALPN